LTDPIWVEASIILFLHDAAIESFGGGSPGQLRATNLTDVLLRPQHTFHYRDPKPDTIELAAIYALSLCKGHIFIDGNKRTAFLTCATLSDD
jgi:death on curing protein